MLHGHRRHTCSKEGILTVEERITPPATTVTSFLRSDTPEQNRDSVLLKPKFTNKIKKLKSASSLSSSLKASKYA